MRKLLNLAGICFLTLIVIFTIIIYLVIDSQPLIKREVSITPEQIARAKLILDTHHYQVRPGTLATVNIRSDDLDIALNYLAYHFGQGYAKAKVRDNRVQLLASLPVPAKITGGYFNLKATLTEANGSPGLSSMRIGSLSIPDSFANLLASQLLAWLQTISPDMRVGLDAFRKLQFSRDGMTVSYYWQGWNTGKDSHSPLGSLLSSRQDLDRLLRYHRFLNERNRQHNSQPIPLSEILTQVMRETVQHSPQGNVLEEFCAAILITAFHVLQLPPRLILPEAADWPDPVRISITLDGRADFAMHFMASAAITTFTDTVLSNAIGLYKELEDARSGSGFSFNDMIANRSGTSFAEKATVNQDSARKMRNMILSGIHDTDLIPYWRDLPEHMTEDTFKARFGGIDSPQYHKIMDKIERRVASLRLLR